MKPRQASWSTGSIPVRSSTTISTSPRSEEHTSELQSLTNLVCRLLLEKKKNNILNTASEHDFNDHEVYELPACLVGESFLDHCNRILIMWKFWTDGEARNVVSRYHDCG